MIAGVFIYFGFDTILHPSNFANLVPGFAEHIMSAETIVMIHGAIEIICGLLIIFELAGFIPYIVLMISFLGVLIAVSGFTLARDLAIFGGLLLLTHIAIKKDMSKH